MNKGLLGEENYANAETEEDEGPKYDPQVTLRLGGRWSHYKS